MIHFKYILDVTKIDTEHKKLERTIWDKLVALFF